MLKRLLAVGAALAACCCVSPAFSDATLAYRTIAADGSSSLRTFSVAGRFVRMDTEGDARHYTLVDTGRMPMFEVGDSTRSFRTLHTGR